MSERVEMAESDSPPWYAIWTRSHFEQLVSDQLAVKGFEMFLPKTTAWARRVRSRQRVQTLLFPGYVFVRHPWTKPATQKSSRCAVSFVCSETGGTV